MKEVFFIERTKTLQGTQLYQGTIEGGITKWGYLLSDSHQCHSYNDALAKIKDIGEPGEFFQIKKYCTAFKSTV